MAKLVTYFSKILCVLFYVTLLSSVNQSAAEPEPGPGTRYHAPWSMINNPQTQSYFNPPIVSSSSGSSRFHRPSYFVGYNPMPDVDEEYEQSAVMVAKMSRLLETALVHLNEQVDDLKQQLKSETERNRRLEQQVDQLKQSVAKQEERQRGQDFGEDQGISQYARFNGLVTTALGLGRPWIKTFFSLRKSSSFASTGTPITYEVTDANVGSTISSGIFTAPRSGYYYFSFNGVTDASVYPVNAALIKNGGVYTTAYGTASSYSPLSIQELMVLNANDAISIQLQIPSGQNSSTTGTLYEDGSSYFTRFTGFSIALL